MGVPGLTAFVDEHRHQLLKDFHLRETRIVIDGNNLVHFIYHYFNVNNTYGGNYDVLASHVRYFFSVLRRCRVTSYVIFDGGYDTNDKKLPTILRRAVERIRLAGIAVRAAARGQRGPRLLPVLARRTFCEVLDEMNVLHITCDAEADEHIAAMSRHFNCPVLSNDSDFFVYNIPAGLILLDYLNLQEHVDEDGCYLNVQLYRNDALFTCFPPISVDTFALFATLIGNDTVSTKLFQDFFSRVKMPSLSNANKCHKKLTQCRLRNLLLWLQTAENFESAIKSVLAHISTVKGTDVEQIIRESVNAYSHPISNLYKHFDECDTSNKQSVSALSCSAILPDWFRDLLRTGRLPVLAVNARLSQRVILLAQVECCSLPSTNQCALLIRRAAYTVLLNGNTLSVRTIAEHDRNGKRLMKHTVLPLSDVNPPNLNDMPMLDKGVRLDFMKQALGMLDCQAVWQLPADVRMVAIAIVCWVRNAQPRVSHNQLRAQVLCVIKLHLIDRLQARADAGLWTETVVDDKLMSSDANCGLIEKHDEEITMLDNARRLLSISQVRSSARTLNALISTPVRENALQWDVDCVHNYAQLQACMHALFVLNAVLCCPLMSLAPHHLFNGTVVYRVLSELRRRRQPDEYLVGLLGRDTHLAYSYRVLYDAVLEAVDASIFLNDSTLPSKRKARKQNRKQNMEREPPCGKPEVGDEDGDDDDDDVCDDDDDELAAQYARMAIDNHSNRYAFFALGEEH